MASAGHLSFAVHYKSAHGGKLMQQCFVARPCDIYAEIMRLSSILIERDDDINMKYLWSPRGSSVDSTKTVCLV